MKFSIHSKFSVGMVFLLIILVLSIFSAYDMNKMSEKSGVILKENYLSVVYAREMAGSLTNINQETTNCFLTNRKLNSLTIRKELDIIAKSLQAEKNNITEPGEGKLVSDIENGIGEYRDSVVKFTETPLAAANILHLQKQFGALSRQLLLLSQMNGKAIEVKTDAAKVSSQDAVTQMSIIATLCFIIALSFSYSFSSYSKERFNQLYNGIKEIASRNYKQKLYFEGSDEFYEISLIFNQMIEKLNENQQKISVALQTELDNRLTLSEIQELKNLLFRLRNIEGEATALIARLEDKNTHLGR